jgi:hypothetical protein
MMRAEGWPGEAVHMQEAGGGECGYSSRRKEGRVDSLVVPELGVDADSTLPIGKQRVSHVSPYSTDQTIRMQNKITYSPLF